jgi:hypothetical protein
MNKDSNDHLDDLKGALSFHFEEDIQLPPNDNWSAIEKELFPKKKRKFVVFWFISLSLFLGGIIYHNSLLSNDKNINSQADPKSENNKSKARGEQEFQKHSNQTNLNEQTRDSADKKNESKTNQERSQSTSLQNTAGKNYSIALNQNNRKNRVKASTQEELLNDDINDKSKEEPNRPEYLSDETSDMAVKAIDYTSTKAIISDSIARLELLPVQLISMSFTPIILNVPLEKHVGFKPYFSIYISPLIGRNIRNIRGTFNSENTNSNAIGDRRVSLPKYGFQTGLNYHINEKLSFNLGFQLAGGDIQSRWFFKYLEIDPMTNDVRLKTASGEASTKDPALIQSISNGVNGLYKLRLNHTFTLYSIPLGISYRFKNKKFSPFIRTGLNMEFFGKRTLSLDMIENGMVRNIELNLNRPNNRLNLQAMLSLGLDWRLNRNWSLFTEFGYCIPLNRFVTANGYSIRMAGSSIMGGVRYILK